ncbi:hypothetical protein JHU04_000047 [Brenneria sp. 4F2]|nr:hypothetical protein [Brenneria bubanii]
MRLPLMAYLAVLPLVLRALLVSQLQVLVVSLLSVLLLPSPLALPLPLLTMMTMVVQVPLPLPLLAQSDIVLTLRPLRWPFFFRIITLFSENSFSDKNKTTDNSKTNGKNEYADCHTYFIHSFDWLFPENGAFGENGKAGLSGPG